MPHYKIYVARDFEISPPPDQCQLATRPVVPGPWLAVDL